MQSAFVTPFSGSYLPDQDGGVILGRARFFNIATDWMGLAHYDNATSANYALGQNAAGATILNSKEGQGVTFAQGGSGKWGIAASTYYLSDLGAGGVIHLTVRATPSAPPASSMYLYAKTNAAKVTLYGLFPTGVEQSIKAEP